jgi:hypothetical protein
MLRREPIIEHEHAGLRSGGERARVSPVTEGGSQDVSAAVQIQHCRS